MYQIDEKKLLAYYVFMQKRSRTGMRRLLHRVITLLSAFIIRVIQHSDGSITPVKTDILFLHTHAGNPHRIKQITDILERQGVLVRHHVLSMKRMFAGKEFCTPGYRIHRLLYPYAAYASYIVKTYRPKMLVTMMDSHPLSSFLRREMSGIGPYVNIAHCPSEPNHYFSMFDFDYYFVFGESSLRELQNNPIRIGSTRAIPAGSPYLSKDSITIPEDFDARSILYFSSQKPPGPLGKMLRENSKIVYDWAREHPEYRLKVKLHPLEDREYTEYLSRNAANVTILEKDIDVIEALQGVAAVIIHWSSASLEAAMMRKPIVIVNRFEIYRNFLDFPLYFPPAAASPEELSKAIDETIERYSQYVQNAERFYKHHIERDDSIGYIAECLSLILNGNEPKGMTPISEKTDTLFDM